MEISKIVSVNYSPQGCPHFGTHHNEDLLPFLSTRFVHLHDLDRSQPQFGGIIHAYFLSKAHNNECTARLTTTVERANILLSQLAIKANLLTKFLPL